MIKYYLPELYEKWFSPTLLQYKIQETKANCDNCSMQPGIEKGKITYQAHLKCCTFHPFQPNYLLGGYLINKSNSAAVSVIEKKIETRQYALPIGIVAPVPHQVEFNHRKELEFGNREDWLCPYYNKSENNCGLWQWRGAVCTSFYCKSSYGKKGLHFWDRMSDYLTYVEAALMEEALVMLDFSPRQISENLGYLNRFEASQKELAESVLPKSKALELWNGYFDDQIGFYKKCYEIVMNMNKKEFKIAMGEHGQMIEKDLFQALAEVKLK